jgi:hypothetical protein
MPSKPLRGPMTEFRRRALQMLVIFALGLAAAVGLQSLRSTPDPTLCHPWDRSCAKPSAAR